MKVVPFEQINAHAWNEACERSSQAWLYHTAEWINIEGKYFFPENHSFALFENDSLVATQPLYQTQLGLGSWNETLIHSGIHRHTGLALVDGLDRITAKTARATAMRHIETIAQASGANRIQLNSHTLAPENLSIHRREIPFWVLDHGFYQGLAFGPNGILPAPGCSTCCADQVVLLEDDEDDLFKRLNGNSRGPIKKAVVAGVECRADAPSVEDYYTLAQASAKRTNESLPSLNYYQDLWDSFNGKGFCEILFAQLNGKNVAAVWLLVYKNSATYMAGISDPNHLPIGVNDFIQWETIRWAKRAGLKYYRLGPIYPELPVDWPVVRVSKFKGKFGGTSYPIIQGSHFLTPEKYSVTGKANVEMLATWKSGRDEE